MPALRNDTRNSYPYAPIAGRSKAGTVAAHREATGWEDPYRPIGTMPGLGATERRTHFTAAWHALGQPEAGLDETQLTEGQLRVRVHAAQAELTWAPPFADDALRAAEAAYEHARQDAALAHAAADQAETAGRIDEALELRAAADEAAAVADVQPRVIDQLTQAAHARTQWATTAAVTLDYGRRARAEADRRGLDLNHQADQTTTTEYLAARATDSPVLPTETLETPVPATDQLSDAEADAEPHVEPEAERVRDEPHEEAALGELDDAVEPEPSSSEPIEAGDSPTSAPDDAPEQSLAHERVPVDPTPAELDLLVAASAMAVQEVADRQSQEAAHVDPEIDEMHSEDAERANRDAIDFDAGIDPLSPSLPAPGTEAASVDWETGYGDD